MSESPRPAEVDLILHSGKIATLDAARPFAQAVAIADGRFAAVGDDVEVMRLKGAATKVVDLCGRTAIPGLNDSHLHLIRGGLNYNMELRWDGVPSLADALRMLKDQAIRTPPPQWVRVVGGWNEFQFAERRLPTLDEINAAAPETPVFILHLYDHALLNAAALRACGYTKDSPDPPGGEIRRGKDGTPTGLLVARPSAMILYSTLAKGPKLPPEYQENSTRHFMREMNRLGITSAIDAGGGYQNYPEDYEVVDALHKKGELTVRIAYNLFTQRPKHEFDDFSKWIGMTKPRAGDDTYRLNGAGEMLVFSAADFEDFLEPRPDLPDTLEDELHKVVKLLAENRWPFRIHATYNESITRFLDVFERVDREVPFDGLRWFFDHAETIDDRNLERVKALGGGIAVQHRMAFQGEYFIDRYGAEAAAQSPPFKKMLAMGIPVGAGSDATRVASYNPWVSLYWLTAGKTVGGATLYPEANRLDRMEALRRYTHGSAWFSGDEHAKGLVAPGHLADLAVISDDYFSVPEERIKGIESVLTILGGKPVYARDEFRDLDPPTLPVTPDWSPVKFYGGYYGRNVAAATAAEVQALAHAGCCAPSPSLLHALLHKLGDAVDGRRRVGLGCDCFAF